MTEEPQRESLHLLKAESGPMNSLSRLGRLERVMLLINSMVALWNVPAELPLLRVNTWTGRPILQTKSQSKRAELQGWEASFLSWSRSTAEQWTVFSLRCSPRRRRQWGWNAGNKEQVAQDAQMMAGGDKAWQQPEGTAHTLSWASSKYPQGLLGT